MADVRHVLQATLDKISQNHTVDSDQFYISNLYGDQEYARTLLAQGPPIDRKRTAWIPTGYQGQGHLEEVRLELPDIKPEQTTEYHITIDYTSTLFQPMSYYHAYLAWVFYAMPTPGSLFDYLSPSQQTRHTIPADILASPPPFAATIQPRHDVSDEILQQLDDLQHFSWYDVSLGTNVISKEVFSLIHFTPPKQYRDIWWSRMWYYPHGHTLMRAAPLLVSTKPLIITPDGREWRNYEKADTPVVGAGGAWADGSSCDDFLPWDETCKRYEQDVFPGHERQVAQDELFGVPAPPPPPPRDNSTTPLSDFTVTAANGTVSRANLAEMAAGTSSVDRKSTAIDRLEPAELQLDLDAEAENGTAVVIDDVKVTLDLAI